MCVRVRVCVCMYTCVYVVASEVYHSPVQDGSSILLLIGQQWGGSGLPQTAQPAQEENQSFREGEE